MARRTRRRQKPIEGVVPPPATNMAKRKRKPKPVSVRRLRREAALLRYNNEPTQPASTPDYDEAAMLRFVSCAEVPFLQILHRQGIRKLRSLGARPNNRFDMKLPVVKNKLDYSTGEWVNFIDKATAEKVPQLQKLVFAVRKRLKAYE